MIDNSEVIALFTNIANTHPAIQNGEVLSSGNAVRFWGFSLNQLVSESTSNLNFDRLLLGLSSTGFGGLKWDYQDTGTASRRTKFIPLHIISKFAEGDFDDEEAKAQLCENCLNDIITWLTQVANGWQQDTWPVVGLMNLKMITVQRLNNIGMANCTGVVAKIELREYADYNNTNPLNGMTP